MGLLSAMTGNAGEITQEEATTALGNVLLPGERIEKGYQVGRDLIVFTDKRLVLVDKQGMSGSKLEFHTIPYRAVTHFSIETAGPMDLDAEMKIWITGNPLPISKEFNKKVNVYEVQALLAARVLG